MSSTGWSIKVPFYGKWSMKVLSRNSSLQQRVVIESSLASDGMVEGIAGQSVAVIDGPKWYAFTMSTQDPAAGWNANATKRVPGVISPDGLIVTLYSDDNRSGNHDDDFNDLIVQFTYLNPEVNPAGVPPYEFTVPSGSFRPRLPGRDKPRCKCECVCTCRTNKRARRACGC